MFSRRKSLIGNSAEFENYARLNKEPVKIFQKWDRMKRIVVNTFKFVKTYLF